MRCRRGLPGSSSKGWPRRPTATSSSSTRRRWRPGSWRARRCRSMQTSWSRRWTARLTRLLNAWQQVRSRKRRPSKQRRSSCVPRPGSWRPATASCRRRVNCNRSRSGRLRPSGGWRQLAGTSPGCRSSSRRCERRLSGPGQSATASRSAARTQTRGSRCCTSGCNPGLLPRWQTVTRSGSGPAECGETDCRQSHQRHQHHKL
mmetsp:Transcript_106541/g.301325  ORF Transcript_106541/g.301325 Transcript_106541/m.301325 type:complete len:203 (+) Transcript_106541:163-771(+)